MGFEPESVETMLRDLVHTLITPGYVNTTRSTVLNVRPAYGMRIPQQQSPQINLMGQGRIKKCQCGFISVWIAPEGSKKLY